MVQGGLCAQRVEFVEPIGGRSSVADLIMSALGQTIQSKVVTYDFARLMNGAKEVKCSEFGTEIIKNM